MIVKISKALKCNIAFCSITLRSRSAVPHPGFELDVQILLEHACRVEPRGVLQCWVVFQKLVFDIYKFFNSCRSDLNVRYLQISDTYTQQFVKVLIVTAVHRIGRRGLWGRKSTTAKRNGDTTPLIDSILTSTETVNLRFIASSRAETTKRRGLDRCNSVDQHHADSAYGKTGHGNECCASSVERQTRSSHFCQSFNAKCPSTDHSGHGHRRHSHDNREDSTEGVLTTAATTAGGEQTKTKQFSVIQLTGLPESLGDWTPHGHVILQITSTDLSDTATHKRLANTGCLASFLHRIPDGSSRFDSAFGGHAGAQGVNTTGNVVFFLRYLGGVVILDKTLEDVYFFDFLAHMLSIILECL